MTTINIPIIILSNIELKKELQPKSQLSLKPPHKSQSKSQIKDLVFNDILTTKIIDTSKIIEKLNKNIKTTTDNLNDAKIISNPFGLKNTKKIKRLEEELEKLNNEIKIYEKLSGNKKVGYYVYKKDKWSKVDETEYNNSNTKQW